MQPIYESMQASFQRNLYRLRSNVIAAPAVSMQADGDFFKRVAEERPQAVLLRVDATLTVLAQSDERIGSLYDCLCSSRDSVPVFCIDSFATIEPLADFVYDHSVGDAVICVPYAKRDVLRQALLRMPLLRGMLDCRAMGKRVSRLQLAGKAWSVGAISVRISEQQCNACAVEAFHERLLSVWCDAPDDPLRVIFDGVDGVIPTHTGRVYAALEALPECSRTRRYRLLAHKGFQNGYTLAENSITAVQRSAKIGLDGAEIDVKLTTDGIPFVIHNPTTKQMLQGEPRVVETLSSVELAARERTDFPGEYTDRLEDMLATVRPYVHHPIFIEFKPAPQFHHIEKMTHAIRDIIRRTDTEHISIALCGTEDMRYIQRLLPTLPKICGTWEEPSPPQSEQEANEMLYRLCQRIAGAPAALCVEDVMVNRYFGEAAALRGIFTVVWTRSWYYKHSLWENDGERSDEGFLSGFFATISDHAEHYLDIPVRITADGRRTPIAHMRDGTKRPVSSATPYELGDGRYVVGVRIVLPHGKSFYMFSNVVAPCACDRQLK